MSKYAWLMVGFLFGAAAWEIFWWATFAYVAWDSMWLSGMGDWSEGDRAFFVFWFVVLPCMPGLLGATAANICEDYFND